MTLDEAIEHCQDTASSCRDTRCAADHAQLAEWLIELRNFRQMMDQATKNRERINAAMEEEVVVTSEPLNREALEFIQKVQAKNGKALRV